MGAPVSDVQAGDRPTAETLLSAFKTIDASERRKHATVLNYWLSIRGDRELPPLHDLDPLEISDAAPSSILLELIGGGEDAEIRHLGETLKAKGEAERIIDAPRPSLLASIANKLSIVAISRNFLSFEDEFSTDEGTTRCWVTLLPLSSAGAWVDYVYGFVSFDAVSDEPAEAVEPAAPEVAVEEAASVEAGSAEVEADVPEDVQELNPVIEEPPVEAVQASDEQPPADATPAGAPKSAPGFSKLIDSLAELTGFYGSHAKVEPTLPSAPDPAPTEPHVDEIPEEVVANEAPAAVEEVEEIQKVEEIAQEPVVDESSAAPAVKEIVDEPVAVEAPGESTSATEGPLKIKLNEVRSMAEEARMAKLRSNTALYEGLSAAYDFALDAEDSPEEYLKLVEAQGLKIQLRSPMTPVVKLAFDGMCDDATISQLEAVLAWALEQDLPRGSLAERIQSEGGIAPILNGAAKAA